MGAERLDGGVVSGDLALGQGRVDLAVAEMVQEDRLAALAAAEFRDEVMPALRHAGRDRTGAERADGYIGACIRAGVAVLRHGERLPAPNPIGKGRAGGRLIARPTGKAQVP